MTHLIGHLAQRQALQTLIEKKRLPSTLLFHGTKRVGKRLVAQELARTILCKHQFPYGGCGACGSCTVFDAGNHPDRHLVRLEEKEESSVGSVRELLYSLHLRPYLSSSRVVLFDNSEHLSLAAANTLLKALEEPRPNTFYILISASSARIPSTILSRCQPFFFAPLSKIEIGQIIELHPEYQATLLSKEEQIEFADGSLENMELLSQHQELWKDLLDRFEPIERGKIAAGIDLAREYSKDRDNLRTRTALLRIYGRKRMLTSPQEQLARWAVFVSNMIMAESYIFDRNLSAQYVLQSIFTSFAEVSFSLFTNSDTLLDRQAV